jgi:uncharacterized protein (DUF1697 family)
MALVVFLRGVNVGGYRTFRPSVLAADLSRFDVVNVGATGTFVVRKAVSPVKVREELSRRLPFHTDVMTCGGSEILALAASDPFAGQPSRPDIVRFVSVLATRRQPASSIPFSMPSAGAWSVRVLTRQGRFVVGLYRRDMKAIRYLGQLDKVFGVPVTTRNWNTILAIAQILSTKATKAKRRTRSPG